MIAPRTSTLHGDGAYMTQSQDTANGNDPPDLVERVNKAWRAEEAAGTPADHAQIKELKDRLKGLKERAYR